MNWLVKTVYSYSYDLFAFYTAKTWVDPVQVGDVSEMASMGY
jgi:hypothetical protein